jgi:WD40 repeat protein
MLAETKVYNKSRESDNRNNISGISFRNILLPWPKSAIWLLILTLIEFIIATSLFANTFYPCGGLDVIRKVNGCIAHISHESMVQNIAFSKDGKTFATYEFQGRVRIWSYPDLKLLQNLGDGFPFGTRLSLSSNGELIAICDSSDTTNIYETQTGKLLHTFFQPTNNGCDISFTPDDRSLISITASELQTWDVATGKLVNSIPQKNLGFLEISPDGSLIAVGRLDGTINILRVSDYTVTATMRQPYLESFAFSNDGKYLFTVEWDIESISINDVFRVGNSVINVWNIKNGEIEHTFTLMHVHIKNISTSEYSDGFAVGAESCYTRGRNPFEMPCAYFWHSMLDKQPTGLLVPNGVDSITFSPTDNNILIGSYANLYIWRVP